MVAALPGEGRSAVFLLDSSRIKNALHYLSKQLLCNKFRTLESPAVCSLGWVKWFDTNS